MDITGGAFIFLAFILIMVVALIYGLYTRAGSGINNHPYARRYGNAPGADTDRARVTGREGIASMTSRGTR